MKRLRELTNHDVAKHTSRFIYKAAILAGIGAVTIYMSHETPEEAFVRDYTKHHKCLEQSEYDPDNGATTEVRTVEDIPVLFVTPAASAGEPTLELQISDKNIVSPTTLHIANQLSATILAKHGCTMPSPN